jgi:hypothetical protein
VYSGATPLEYLLARLRNADAEIMDYSAQFHCSVKKYHSTLSEK